MRPLINFSAGVRVWLPALLIASQFPVVLAQPGPLKAQSWQITDGSRVHPEYWGQVPYKSDVVLSSRFKRPNAVDAAEAFGATRVEWVYSTDEQFVASLKGAVTWFGGAINSNGSSSRIKRPSDEAMAKDFDGNSLIHSWMKPWGRGSTNSNHPGRYVTITHPEARNNLLEQARTYISAGANSIQFDDPLLQINAVLGRRGDFNPSSLSGFSKFLAEYPNRNRLKRFGLDELRGDYREFLKSKYGVTNTDDYRKRYGSLPGHVIWLEYHRHAVKDFFDELRKLLSNAEPPMALSMNLTALDWPDERNWHFFLSPYIDYAMPETHVVDTSDMVVRAATLRAMGIGHVPSLKLRGKSQNRVAIATLYALGSQPIVPWDVNLGNDHTGQPNRFFGTPEDYGDLYQFVRSNQELFNNRELAAVVGIPIPVHRFNKQATVNLVRKLRAFQVPFAFLLAGGTEQAFLLDRERARTVKALLMVNPENDFSSGDLATLNSLPVLRVDANQLTDEAIQEFAPFEIGGNQKTLRLYPRANAKGDSLEIHVVDEAEQANAGEISACQRRFGLKKRMIGSRRVSRATWHTPRSARQVTPANNENDIAFSIRGCDLWGVLSLKLEP